MRVEGLRVRVDEVARLKEGVEATVEESENALPSYPLVYPEPQTLSKKMCENAFPSYPSVLGGGVVSYERGTPVLSTFGFRF